MNPKKRLSCGDNEPSLQPLAGGAVTQANMRISHVDGTAFIDFSAADVLTGKLGCLLVVKDHLGNKIQGFIKAAGDGEDLTEIIAAADDRTFDSDTGWWTESDDTVEISGGKGNFTLSEAEQGLDKAAVLTVGVLYKSIMTTSGYTIGGGVRWEAGAHGTTRKTNATFTEYITASHANLHILAVGADTTISVDDVSFSSVDEPSATGVTIVSAKAGATYNWTNKSSGFDYNDASGYTYEIYRTPAVVVASGGPVTLLNTRLSTVEGNAFAWLNGVDLSAYRDGKHLICLYNVSVAEYCAMGFISDSAPAGESLGDELVVDGGFDDPLSWECMIDISVAGGKALGVVPTESSGRAMWNDEGAAKPVGTLYKVVYTIDAMVGGNMLASLNMLADDLDTVSWQNSAGTKTEYVIRKNAQNQPGLYFIPTITSVQCDDFSIKPVTDPPNTAVKIVNTKGGAVRNFLYMHEDFNTYDYNGQNYKIYYLGD